MENKNTGKKFNEDFKRTVVDLYHAGSSARLIPDRLVDNEF
ncbi:hypothetical protein [Aneurinibacillus aneurinilyticus]|uniref:Uncharacterized protein n=1 Tax=Aneurinibacillus aneurinilyticus ATCC 12856 TaxID=649747 RepID=U1YI94_ANEAE|nr:hypothetical protein [Aneurinibacillus aneurinilyticus]ERI11812.1 hypothetical protein HMPREF0083_00089 [Aneurinibacillus aneurinilyticus ATCC 12856]MED0709594.1 hypothetical protein [Aneurinibacillus aneurinilyticus]MED0724860.1 hypothetical protein [Aneurinibacillus aneurinilyticus]MED0735382.1 hypothetical protein [Aneurinibacillus aneurinilyticus]MED0742376.1 hypothetical protein [Aneurinibacillus aneurinilyticus]